MKKLIAVLLVAVLALTMALSVCAESESWTDPDTDITDLQLLNCDQKPSGSNNYEVDKEDMQEGEGCLSFVVSVDSVNQMPLPEPIDGEGCDTLEFDIYVSDAILFDLFTKGNSGFEITSSGYCDNQEISWKLSEIKEFNKGGELVEGWNHIILPLETAVPRSEDGHHPEVAGPFDITKINFMRFFMVGESGEHTITVKLDNICLSNRQAVTAEAEKQAAAKKAADKVIDKISELDEVTAENYESRKLKVISYRIQYDKLSDDAKAYVSKALLDKLAAAEAKIAEFEANPPKTEDENENNNADVQDPATNDSGCKGMMSVGAIAVLVMALSLGATALNKKEN